MCSGKVKVSRICKVEVSHFPVCDEERECVRGIGFDERARIEPGRGSKPGGARPDVGGDSRPARFAAQSGADPEDASTDARLGAVLVCGLGPFSCAAFLAAASLFAKSLNDIPVFLCWPPGYPAACEPWWIGSALSNQPMVMAYSVAIAPVRHHVSSRQGLLRHAVFPQRLTASAPALGCQGRCCGRARSLPCGRACFRHFMQHAIS